MRDQQAGQRASPIRDQGLRAQARGDFASAAADRLLHANAAVRDQRRLLALQAAARDHREEIARAFAAA